MEGCGDPPPVGEASSSSCHLHLLIYSKNNSGRAAGRHQWGSGLEEGGTEGGPAGVKGARLDQPGPAPLQALGVAAELGFLSRPTPPHPTLEPESENPGFPNSPAQDVVWSHTPPAERAPGEATPLRVASRGTPAD